MSKDLIKALNEMSQEDKNLLRSLLNSPKTTLPEPVNIMDRVKTVQDAYTLLGFKRDPKEDSPGLQLENVYKALNEGWQPIWENPGQAKYHPHFEYTNDGFSLRHVDHHYSYTDVSSRLCAKSEEIAEYIATQFIELYNKYLKY